MIIELLSLLLIVIVCGALAYWAQNAPIQDFFKVTVYVVLFIIIVVAVFQIIFHISINSVLR